ncbi:MAG TPA: bifunctional precorrin-2 dehydrogenase/sirohydrochlorin ferrochelatase [Selenomonadales bacterium]|nr:bifunctional precorrin-2 dehydrogenase/sirohydrochlorin ferrochelatase [Selenomonadales bacterium]
MSLYPVNLRLTARECLVLGGGAVAERKVLALLAAGASVTVLSPGISPCLTDLAAESRLTYRQDAYRPGVIGNYFIVICATDSPEVNRAAAGEARAKGALVNVADAPELCDFTVPAHFSRGDLLITVSTGGGSPALAKRLREELAESFGPEYGVYLEILARIRTEMKRSPAAADAKGSFWREALDGEVLALVKAGKIDEAEEKIRNAARSVRA